MQEIQGTKDRIDEVEQDALETGYAPIAKMPSATDVIKQMLDEEEMYRLLSAVTHGHNWAIRGLVFSPVLEGDLRPDVGGGGPAALPW